jgi:glycosyltransferase involved in cell wall biosynthesis
MKIGITAYCCDPSRGTEFGLGWGWAKAYALRGHDVTVLTSRDASSREGRAMASLQGELPPGLRFVELAHEVADSISSPDGLSAMMSFHRSNQAWIDEASAYLSAHAFDVVHHVSGGSVQGGSPLRDVKAGAVVFGPVGGGQRAPWRSIPYLGGSGGSEIVRSLLWAPALGRRGKLSRSFENIDLALATNSDTANLMTKLGVRDVTVMLADGIDGDDMVGIDGAGRVGPRVRRPSDPLRLTWIGRLAPRKGVRTMLQTASELHRRRFPFVLDIIGDGDMMPEVRRVVGDDGLEQCVHVRGHVPHDEVITGLDRADAHLFTSWRDSFGAQCLEAWGRGVPTIYLDLHGIRDFGPMAGGVRVAPFPAGSAHLRLASAIERFAEDEDGAKNRAELAMSFARRERWTAKVERIEIALNGPPVHLLDRVPLGVGS